MGWRDHINDVPDYARLSYERQAHHRRFVAYVEAHGLLCQSCSGAGGERYVLLDDGTGPWEPCGWCEGTGKVTRWLRGLWLRTLRDEAQARRRRAA
ncbi:MAG: hypothetical protein GEV06_19655 [Luteitalea sp.]|nr:hypothetical protein [Luteitalea sp.]